jgi:hypothetical protein
LHLFRNGAAVCCQFVFWIVEAPIFSNCDLSDVIKVMGLP